MSPWLIGLAGGLLLALMGLGACGPAPSAAPAPASGASASAAAPAAQPADPLSDLTRRAQQEGTLSLTVPPGQQYRDGVQAFQQAYPGIQVEVKGEHIRDAHPRILKEREAGIYSNDVMIGAIGAGVFLDWIPQGVLAPVEPAILSAVRDDGKWANGFGAGWQDKAQKYVYGFISSTSPNVDVNRDVVTQRDLPSPSNLDALLDPRWQGKIVWDDPRELGPGVNFATLIMQARGEDYLKRLIQEQEIVASRDVRQIVEYVARGRYPIGFALNNTILEELKKEGIGRNVRSVDIVEINQAVPGFGSVSIFDKAPHPNAAALFVNWLLSQEGQTAYTAASVENSRRTDVAPTNPLMAPKPGVEYTNLQKEDSAPIRARAAQVANEAIH